MIIPVSAGAGVEIDFVVGIINQAAFDPDISLYLHRGDIGAVADGFNNATGQNAEERE
jgi:hypothetical protein